MQLLQAVTSFLLAVVGLTVAKIRYTIPPTVRCFAFVQIAALCWEIYLSFAVEIQLFWCSESLHIPKIRNKELKVRCIRDLRHHDGVPQ